VTVLQTTARILDDLIGFPTVSSESNIALIDYAAERLDVLGAKLQITRDETGQKANLFATIGPDIDGGVVLSGHTDVVPVEGQDWSADPFKARHRDDRIFGRGACDMKGFIACALTMAPGFAAAKLERPLHLALTYDEEVGCMGAQVMLKALAATGRRPRACIIGEPTEMRVIEGHKGGFEYTTRFHGLEGHSAYTDKGVSAIAYAGRYLAEMNALADDLKARAPADSPFDPPWTTINPGRIEGGTARNVIAPQCLIEWEFRPVNKADADYVRQRLRTLAVEELLPRMQAVHPGADIRTEIVGEIAGLEPMPDSEAVALAQFLTGGNAVETVSFSTEAGLFQELDIPTVVCGPGSIDQAHKPDEFVALEQLQQCLGMIGHLLPRLAGEHAA